MIDFCLFGVMFFPITRIVKGTWIMTARDHRWQTGLFITDPICIIFLIVIFVYFVILEGYGGATMGKYMMGMRVVDLEGNRPGLKKSLIRNILRLVDGLPAFNIIGVWLILKSKEAARFGDRIAGTRVIKAK
jgi:uncharacterized RDD family membrane protein YckC